MMTVGRRVYTRTEEYPYEIEARLLPGDYAFCEMIHRWICIAPNGAQGSLPTPPFTIIEHEDGTITVGPASILFKAAGNWPEYHGYLHKGVWA